MEETKFWKAFVENLSCILISKSSDPNICQIHLTLKLLIFDNIEFPYFLQSYTFLIENNNNLLVLSEENPYRNISSERSLNRHFRLNGFLFSEQRFRIIKSLNSGWGLRFYFGLDDMKCFINSEPWTVFYSVNYPPQLNRIPISGAELLQNINSHICYHDFRSKLTTFLVCLKRKSIHILPLSVEGIINEVLKDRTYKIETFCRERENEYLRRWKYRPK